MKEFISQLIKKHTRLSKSTLKVLIPAIVIIVLVSYAAYWASNLPEGNIKLQSPIQNFIRIEPELSKGSFLARKALAKEAELPDIGDCEQYRPTVQKYFGKLTDEALFVAKMESGCIADRISEPNKDGTRDFCLFQINKERLTVQSLEVCTRRAFEKYVQGRVGDNNWSAFYAVCDTNAKPKYPKIINNCN